MERIQETIIEEHEKNIDYLVNDFIEKSDQYFKLAGLLFVITTFIPLLPSGSFFTSHAATLFWMNYAFMNLSQKDLKL